MSSPNPGLPPAPAGAAARGMAGPPGRVVAAVCATGALALVWPVQVQAQLLEAGSPWLAGMLGLAVAALPLWLGRQLWRQSRTVQEQARRLQQQDAQLQALGRSAELLRQAEQLAELGSFDWDPTSGALHWSDGHYRLWGHAPGALVPDYAAFRARIHPDDLAGLEARLQHSLQTGSSYEFTHRVCWPDGTLREVLARGDVTCDGSGRAVRMVGTVQDITRRRAAEARLQLHEFVLNTITDPVSVVDEHRAYLLVNQAWSRWTGASADQVLGHAPAALKRLLAVPERDAALQRCLAGGPSEVVLAALQQPGADLRWWETTLYPFTDPRGRRGAALVWRDVTARETAARALEASVDNLRMTLNATGDAIFASNAAGAHEPLLFVNDRMLQMWNIPADQAASLTPAGVMAAARPFFVDPVHETARVAEVIASRTLQEDRLSLTDGRVLLRRCIPTQLAGREVRVWGFRDITIESRALAGLRTAEAQQRALLAAFPGYIACISAEQRFTYANARLAALLETTPQALVGQPVGEISGPERAPQLAHRIARVLDGEVISYERLHPATARRPAVHVLVTLARGLDRSTGQYQCYAFGTDITPQKRTEAALLAAKDEAESANRVMAAFLSRMSHELRTPMNSVLGFAQMLQADARPALAPHQQEQVREILRGGRQLMGLINGLFDLAGAEASRMGVEAPGQPPPDGGAPAAALPTPAPAWPPAAAGAGAGDLSAGPPRPGPLPVLYIDDNPVNTLLMAAMFERLPGLTLRCESDPRQGLALALASPPALLLVDIQMPGLDGYQLLQLLRADPATRAVPAIAVSANAMPQDLARGQAAGFADYLTKPLELQRLQSALQAALPGWVPPG
jgi:PAS domain S-box-containing protein